MSESAILEIEGLYLAENLAEEYESQYGMKPFNLSHWDPSEQTTRELLKYLRLPKPTIVIPYIYSYDEGQHRTLRQLGFSSSLRHCWFVNSGTIAVLLAAWWLKAQSIDRLVVLGPTYFPIFHMQTVICLPTDCLYMRRVGGSWHLPQEEILAAINSNSGRTALWVTNPVFSTGCYLSDGDSDFLAFLLRDGATLVVDECLSINGKEIGPKFETYKQFLGIYSPHKSLCINSTKFAAVVYDQLYEDFFQCWTDVLAGPLASSSYSSINHFLGENFVDFQHTFLANLASTRDKVLKVIHQSDGLIDTDKDSIGNFITCYAQRIPGINGNDAEFLRDLIWSTGATLIPGIRSYMDPALGFSFRINLARACTQFYSALHRLTNYLRQHSLRT